MECCLTDDFKRLTGLNSNILNTGGFTEFDQDSNVVNFFPKEKKGKCFLKLVCGFQSSLSFDEIFKIVREYTNHTTWYCTTINLLLAADSPELKKHASYVKKLRWAIKNLSFKFPVKETVCYRGMKCSKKEIDHYRPGRTIYIPSFLSTSRNPMKFYLSNKQNTLMVIRLNRPPKSAFSVNQNYSEFAEEEEEALFSCYSKFKIVKLENDIEFNGKVFEYYLELEFLEEYEQNNEISFLALLGVI